MSSQVTRTVEQDEAGLRSGQLADAAGVNVQTLRYYERRGLLAEPDRSLGGHRLYPPDALEVLRVIKAAQRMGFTLDEAADLLTTTHPRRSNRTRGDLQVKAEAKLAEVDAKLLELLTIRDTLRAAIAAGCTDLVACAGAPDCPVPFTETSRTGALTTTASTLESTAGAITDQEKTCGC